jgi:hypothetical protein
MLVAFRCRREQERLVELQRLWNLLLRRLQEKSLKLQQALRLNQKFEFQKDLQNQKERVANVNQLADKLIDDQHPEEETNW